MQGGIASTPSLGRFRCPPLVQSNALTARITSRVPNVTGKNAAANAHRSRRENCDCLRASLRIMQPLKQIAGATITMSIQNDGVADKSSPSPLVAYHARTARHQTPEQRRSTTETAEGDTR